MWRLTKTFCTLKRGPHGGAVIAVVAASLLVLGLLVACLAYESLRVPVLVVAVGCCLVALALVTVLLDRLRAKLNDVHYALSLEGGLQRAGYALADLFTDEAAANPSLQLFNLKVLRLCRPRSVLELGSGQTTKLLSCYARQNPSAYLLTLEQDEAWWRRLKADVAHDYRFVPLAQRSFTCAGTGLSLTTSWYKDLPELRDRKFEYILVDGPDAGPTGTGSAPYARCGILQYLPSVLDDSFVMVFDDVDRYGEVLTTNAVAGVLRACNVRFIRFTIHGVKRQVVFCSRDKAYLRSI